MKLSIKIVPFLFAGILGSSILPVAQAQTVYVESNLAEGNSLLGYSLGADGSLKPTNAVATNGKGVVDPSFALGPFDSDQEIIVNPEKTLLFSVNSGSNSISVFQILGGGNLQAIPGSPFDSHGVNPVSLGLKGSILTVVNKHGDPAQATDASLPNYTTFFVSVQGQLQWTGSEVDVANGSSPSQALVAPFAPFVFGADFLGGILRSFAIDRNGSLYAESALGLPASEFGNSQTPRLPLGLAANPYHPLVYVGFPTTNKIGVYRYNRYGWLSFQNAISDSGNVVCWLATNHEGTLLYASNTADPSITVYDIASNPEVPREIQKLALPSKGGAYQIALSPDESKLLVLTQRFQASTPEGSGNEIHVLNVDPKTGAVSEAPNSPTAIDLPGDTRPQGIVVL